MHSGIPCCRSLATMAFLLAAVRRGPARVRGTAPGAAGTRGTTGRTRGSHASGIRRCCTPSGAAARPLPFLRTGCGHGRDASPAAPGPERVSPLRDDRGPAGRGGRQLRTGCGLLAREVMRGASPSRRGLAALVLLVATAWPISVRPHGEGDRGQAVCTNRSCSCGVHEAGVACCCDAGGSPESGPSLGGGCSSRSEADPGAPDTPRLAILPPARMTPGPLPSGLLARGEPTGPAPRGGPPPDPVPRPCA